jgi:hypothetical protein
VERAKENLLVAAEVGYMFVICALGRLLDKDDPQRFRWFGRAAAANVNSYTFSSEMLDQIPTSIPEPDMQRSFSQSNEL